MQDTHPDTTTAAGPPETRSIWSRDFVLAFTVFLAFLVAIFALLPTLPVFLARSGMNETEIGVLVGIYGVSSLISRLLVGGALLRFSERTVLMTGALLFGFTFLALILFRPFWPFAAVRLLQGFCFAAVDTAALAFAITMIPVEQRSRAIGYFVLAPPLAQAATPALAMFLANRYGFTVLFLACAALSVCAFLFSLRLPGRRTPSREDAAPRRVRFLDPRVIAPAVPTFIHGIAWGSIMAFLPLYALQNRITNPGLYFSAVGGMLIIGRAFGGRIMDIYRREPLLTGCLSVLTIALVALAFSKSLFTLVLVGMVWGVGNAFFFPTAMAYSLEYAGSSDGAAVGTFRALADFGVAVGPAIMGLVIPVAGYTVMFLILAALFATSIIYFRLFLAKKKTV